MPSFFIDRPIFAVVVALFVCLCGALALPFLPVAQYPIIAPPSISISTSYPGASPENLYNSVTRLIEEELNGANGILNFESTSDSLGQVEIIANFVPGTESSIASVEVQNRIKRVEARLPRAVMQQGILIEEASSAVLQIVTPRSTDGSLDEVGLGDFMIRNVLGEIRRIPGVGRATLFSTERSMGGMIAVVVLALAMVPVFFVFLQQLMPVARERKRRRWGRLPVRLRALRRRRIRRGRVAAT